MKQNAGADEFSAQRKRRRGVNPAIPLAAFGAIVGTIATVAAANREREYYDRRHYAPRAYYGGPAYGHYDGPPAYHYHQPRVHHGGSGGQPGYSVNVPGTANYRGGPAYHVPGPAVAAPAPAATHSQYTGGSN